MQRFPRSFSWNALGTGVLTVTLKLDVDVSCPKHPLQHMWVTSEGSRQHPAFLTHIRVMMYDSYPVFSMATFICISNQLHVFHNIIWLTPNPWCFNGWQKKSPVFPYLRIHRSSVAVWMIMVPVGSYIWVSILNTISAHELFSSHIVTKSSIMVLQHLWSYNNDTKYKSRNVNNFNMLKRIHGVIPSC